MTAVVLDVIQRVSTAVGIGAPTAAVGTSDDSALQLVELLNQECRALTQRRDWSFMIGEATFVTVATESQGSLSTIVGGSFGVDKIINDTLWNRSTQQPIYGPVTKPNWQARKALALTGPYPEYTIQAGSSWGDPSLYLYPAPAAGENVYFQYKYKRWVKDASSSDYYDNIEGDDDILIFPEHLLLAGLEWRWLRKKGLSYAEEFASYEAMVKAAASSDGTKATLNMAGPSERIRPGIFVPIGSWNL